MENDLEAIAKRRVQARMGFVIHLLMYVSLNTGLAIIWFVTGRGYPWFMWPLIGWGIGIIAHALALLIGPDTPREQRAIEKELRRLRAQPR